MSITTIEKLPNEFFYEIFECLDGCEIYQAFSNLNHRFQQLINSSSLLFIFNFHPLISDDVYTNIFKQFLVNHKHQIVSFHIQKNDFFSFSIDSSFHRLQSLVIGQISSTVLTPLLSNLSSLPRLASLTVNIQYRFSDLTEVYRLIFTLPKLKYIKCSANEHFTSVSLPVANDEQFSPIKHLVINHECAMDTLCTLLSYTPQVCHLSLNDLSESDSDNEIVLSVTLSNLTYLSIEMCHITFDDLETFIIETECNLKVLRVISYSDYDDYIDGDRWEELIVNYLPELEKFYLEYRQDIDPESGSLSDFEPPDKFNSLFWNERKWVLEVEMNSFEYIYSVRSYEYSKNNLESFINHLFSSRERWYDVDHSNEISDSTRLKLTDLSHDDDFIMVLHLIIRDLLAITQIYHLEISEENISSDILLKIIHKFSALETLKISSLELSESIDSFIKNKNLRFISKKNKITKIYLENMSTIEEVYFLLNLCPRTKYLKVGFMHNMNIELFIKDILKKIKDDCNQYLRSLCLHSPTADDAMIEKLKEMINGEKLLSNFTIKYVVEKIYLQWE